MNEAKMIRDYGKSPERAAIVQSVVAGLATQEVKPEPIGGRWDDMGNYTEVEDETL